MGKNTNSGNNVKSGKEEEITSSTISNASEGTVIFISNSELDGFREGDGDLMDKLTATLNNIYRYKAIRIIQNAINVPSDKIPLFDNDQLFSLSGMKDEIKDVKILQDNCLKFINSEKFKNKKKIFYIGSRISIKGGLSGGLLESGSLFDKKFIEKLKQSGVKIVVCCLEYKFFKRAAEYLERAYEMTRQQLFLADKIHFLTEPDKLDFERTMDELISDPILRPEKLAQLWLDNKIMDLTKSQKEKIVEFEILNENKKLKDMQSEDIKNTLTLNKNIASKEELKKLNENLMQIKQEQKEISYKLNILNDEMTKKLSEKDALIDLSKKLRTFNLGSEISIQEVVEQKKKCVFASGIYTVDPLTPETITHLAKKMHIKGDNPMEILANRPCNILHFGMIRGEKGIVEAIELGLRFEQQKLENKMIIAGKLMSDLGIISNIFRSIFGIDPTTFYNELAFSLKDQTITKQLKTIREVRQFSNIEKLIAEHGKHEEFNKFCSQFYNTLKSKYPDRGKNIEIYFDVTEDQVRELAMRCKYAIKLDHKGMANNASTMASCLGFFLPVITTCGLVTNKEFLNFELDGIKSDAKFPHIVIMPKEAYSTDNEYGEVRPIKPSCDQIYQFITNDTLSSYLKRLEILFKLYNERIFDCNRVTHQLIEQVFLPLAQEIQLTENTNLDNSGKLEFGK